MRCRTVGQDDAKSSSNLDSSFDSICCWSDSTIVLHWLRKEPARLQTYAGNRVSVTQELTKGCIWKHIPGVDNPADLISRGLQPSEIKDSRLWWDGPSFFKLQTQSDWPESIMMLNFDAPEVLAEAKKSLHAKSSEGLFEFMDSYFSDHAKLVGVYAIVLRAAHYFKLRARIFGLPKRFGVFELFERSAAETAMIRTVQTAGFPDEMRTLMRLKSCLESSSPDEEHINVLGIKLSRSSIGSLSPFLDQGGIIRVGGRTQQSRSLKSTQKHQILLGSN